MKQIELRKFANLSSLEMLEFCEPRRKIVVVDDEDNKITTDTLLLSLNWFGLIVHRHFPKYKYLVNEVITLTGEHGYHNYIDDDLLNKPVNEFLPRIMDQEDDPAFYDFIKQLIYVFNNTLHNFLCIRGESGVVAARSTDVLLVYKHPKIQELKAKRKSNEISPEVALRLFDQIIKNETDFDKTVFALLYRTGGVDRIQSYQLLIERGKVFDLNNTILPFNVEKSYCEGITNLADSLGDSKGAGFSLISNGSALQDSEWFHKKIHNVAQGVKSVTYQTDCGSTNGYVVKMISEDFIKSHIGKYYIDSKGVSRLINYDTYKDIKVGEDYKIRSVAWCNFGKSGKPCSKCFGKMESAIPYNPFTKRSAVPGLFYGSTFGERIGQSILKTKHRIGSAMSVPFIVNPEDEEYIVSDEMGDLIYFNKDILNEENDPYLVLDRDTCLDFADYIAMDNVEDLSINHLRVYESIKIKVNVPNPMTDGYGVAYPIINTSVSSRRARMTLDFIKYLKEQPLVEEGRLFAISLKDWDNKAPAFQLPYINEDLDAYRRRVEESLKFPSLKGRNDVPVTPELHGDILTDFWKVVAERYEGANIIIHDIFLWSCMCTNPLQLDYSMPSNMDSRYFVSFHDCIMNRGRGNAAQYGWQAKVLVGHPTNFLAKNLQGGVLESFLQPIARMR